MLVAAGEALMEGGLPAIVMGLITVGGAFPHEEVGVETWDGDAGGDPALEASRLNEVLIDKFLLLLLWLLLLWFVVRWPVEAPGAAASTATIPMVCSS